MSGICGIVEFGGRPVEESALRSMAEAAPHRSVDGRSFWCDDQVGLASLSLIITPESQREQQPLTDGHITLVADARVDNRDDLIRALDLTGHDPTDADLIAAAYHHWGVDCPQHIIGDFAFAIWDSRERRLLLARDPMSMRALYYRLEPDRLLFATEVKQIIALPGVPVKIHEQALAAYLAGPDMPPEWTFYEGIDQLIAGHALLIEQGRHRLWRFWDVDPDHRIRYKNEDDYADHFRELFKEAVAARLRSVNPVGILLSGGMDSTSVASTAGWLMQQDSTGTFPPFLVFPFAFDDHPECDERHISSLVTDHFGFPVIDVPTRDAWPLAGYPEHGPDRDEPYIGVYQALYEHALALARERNVGLVTSGDRGDLLTAGWNFNHWGTLLTGRWRALWDELRADSAYRQRSIPYVIRSELLWPVLVELWPEYRARWLREPLRRLAGRPQWVHSIYPSWVREDFAQRAHLEETKRLYKNPPSPIREFGRRQRYEMIFTYMHMRGVIWSERTQARFGISFADPWSDRRLTSFVLAIPYEVVSPPRRYKPFTRRAMRDIMPETARQSISKIVPSPFYMWAVREKARATILDLIDNSTAHERGYIDKMELRAHYDNLLAGNPDHPTFWWTLTVEMWLRQFWS
jgi:asparagine synthase (glutamine-hydrolysing)